MRGLRLTLEWAAIGLAAALAVLGLALSGASDRADRWMYDRIAGWRAPPPSPDILIIAIDNRSLQSFGRWPWPRSVHARLLDRLAAAHPRAIGYDVLFTEPSADDAQFAAALKRSRPTYLPLALDDAGDGAHGARTLMPVAPLADSAAAIGHVNVRLDADQLVRTADLTLDAGGRHWPYMMALMAPAAAQGRAALRIAFQPDVDMFRTISFSDVLDGSLDPAFVRNKYVLVGKTADGTGDDKFPVPVRNGGLMTGVDLQANMLNTLLSGTRLSDAPRWFVALVSLVPLALLLWGFWRWRPWLTLCVSLGLAVVIVAGAGALLWGTGVWIGPASALAGILIAAPIWGWRRLAALSRAVERSLETEASPAAPDEKVRSFAPSDRIAVQADAVASLANAAQTSRQQAAARESALQMLSHDMRAPQASILTLLEGEKAGVAPQVAQRIGSYARRTLALADNFVQLARATETPFSPEDINLSELLYEAIDELYPLYSARRIKLVTDGLDHPAFIAGEPSLLLRALLNVLDNAIKYSPDGATILAAIVYDGTHVRCVISDEGPGMTEAQIDALFVRFGAIGTKRNTGSAGAGLGLALVKQVVDRHGGQLKCIANPDKGCRFVMLFPALEGEDYGRDTANTDE